MSISGLKYILWRLYQLHTKQQWNMSVDTIFYACPINILDMCVAEIEASLTMFLFLVFFLYIRMRKRSSWELDYDTDHMLQICIRNYFSSINKSSHLPCWKQLHWTHYKNSAEDSVGVEMQTIVAQWIDPDRRCQKKRLLPYFWLFPASVLDITDKASQGTSPIAYVSTLGGD